MFHIIKLSDIKNIEVSDLVYQSAPPIYSATIFLHNGKELYVDLREYEIPKLYRVCELIVPDEYKNDEKNKKTFSLFLSLFLSLFNCCCSCFTDINFNFFVIKRY